MASENWNNIPIYGWNNKYQERDPEPTNEEKKAARLKRQKLALIEDQYELAEMILDPWDE